MQIQVKKRRKQNKKKGTPEIKA
uniref:Uncharacterized protein n=1 Tax=Rhizophora mucronata TaxID=61149 RepID=A0A2P2JMQ8_RHIMU